MTQSSRDILKDQILAQNTSSEWSGEGYGSPQANASAMADILSGIGITRLEDFGKIPTYEPAKVIEWSLGDSVVRSNPPHGYYTSVPTGMGWDENGNYGMQYGTRYLSAAETKQMQPKTYGKDVYDPEYGSSVVPIPADQLKNVNGKLVYQTGETYGNKVTGQGVPNTYSERQTGNAWGGTFAGDGNTGFRVKFNEMGMPIFYTTAASSSDWGSIAPILSFASMIPGVAPFAMALSAVGNAANGNNLGAVLSALGAASSFGSQYLSGAEAVNGVNSVNGMDLASDLSSGSLSTWLGQNAGNIQTASQAVGVLNALEKGNVAGVINGLINIAPQIGVTIPSDLVKPVAMAATASAISKGDYAGALSAAKMIAENPAMKQDIDLAKQAVNLTTAIKSGNPAGIFSSFVGFAKTAGLDAKAVQDVAKQSGTPVSEADAVKMLYSTDPAELAKNYYNTYIAKPDLRIDQAYMIQYNAALAEGKEPQVAAQNAAEKMFNLYGEDETLAMLPLLAVPLSTQIAGAAGSAAVNAALGWLLNLGTSNDGPPPSADQKQMATAIVQFLRANPTASAADLKAFAPDVTQSQVDYLKQNLDAITDLGEITISAKKMTPEEQAAYDKLHPEEKKTTDQNDASATAATSNMTSAEEKKIVDDALKANPGLTAEAVKQIVDDAVNTIPNLTASQVQNIVNTELAKSPAAVTSGGTQNAASGTQMNVAEMRTALESAIADAKAAGLSGDQALQSAINKVASDQKTSASDLLSKIGATEASLRSDFASQIGALSADMQAKYDALTAEQKSLANTLHQQGVDLNTAITTAQAQTQKQVEDLGTSLNARVDQLMAQGQTYQQATQQAFSELNAQNKQISETLGTQGRAATQSDVDELTKMLNGQSAVDLSYDVNGDKQITQADIDFLTGVVSNANTNWRPTTGPWAATGLYGQMQANEWKRQDDLAAAKAAQDAKDAEAARVAAEQKKQAAIKEKVGQISTQTQRIADQLPAAAKAAQTTYDPIYGGIMQDFDFGSPLDVGFFGPRGSNQAGQNKGQTAKIATGGYLDDLLDLLR